MLIVLSFIVSIDSFFISCLTSGKAKANFVLILFSPLIHTTLCFSGMLLQYKIIPAYKNHLILLYLLIVILIISGLYLFAIYNPQQEMKYKQNNMSSMKAPVIVILLLFCSFDAVVAGIVFVYWGVSIFKSLIFIFMINLFMVLLPIIFKLLQKRIRQ
jgi:putative Mn2+ efflux pump MntP